MNTRIPCLLIGGVVFTGCGETPTQPAPDADSGTSDVGETDASVEVRRGDGPVEVGQADMGPDGTVDGAPPDGGGDGNNSYLDLSLSAGQLFYVDGLSGSNGNTGLTPQDAWRDVEHAQSQVSAGDKVSLSGPINPVNQQFSITKSGEPGAYITYFVEDGKSAWAEANAYDHYHRVFIEAHHIQFHGVHVRHTNNVSGGVHPDSNAILVQGFHDGHQAYNVRIVNNVTSGFGHGIHGGGDHILVAGNEVYDNAFYNPSGGSGISWNNGYAAAAGVDEVPGYRIAILGNCVYDNEQRVVSSGIGLDVKSDGNGIIVGDHLDYGGAASSGPFLIANNVAANNGGRCVNVWMTSNVDVFNNTCIQNGTHKVSGDSPQQGELAVGGYAPYQLTSVRFFNNITWRLSTSENDLADYGSSTFERDYNTHINPSNAEAYGPHDNFGTLDLFISTIEHACGPGWRPRTDATTVVDSGDSQYVGGERDIAGNPRIQGASVDRGAFEVR